MEDSDLLRHYVETGSAEAFNKLMTRHIDLVYAAARRQIRDEHLAQDVTQAVFILLAQKAASVRGDSALPGWLLLTTYYASRDARKLQTRRRLHEHKAAEMNALRDRNPENADPALVDVELDAALARLSTKYRSIVAMHFMENRTFREVGSALGISEDAARVSCARAVQKLRQLLARRGAVVSAAGLTGMMLNQKVHAAPAEVLANVSNATCKTTDGPSANAVVIARHVSRSMKISESSLAGGAIVAAILFSVAAVTLISSYRSHSSTAAIRASSAAYSASPVIPASLSIESTFHNNAHVEFLGVTPLKGGGSWKADGQATVLAPPSPFDNGAGSFTAADLDHRELYRFAFRIDGVTAKAHDLYMLPSGAPAGYRGARLDWTSAPGGVVYAVVPLVPEQIVVNIALALSTGDWDTFTLDASGHASGRIAKTLRPFAASKVQAIDRGTVVLLSADPYTAYDFRCNAVGTDGTIYPVAAGSPRYTGLVGLDPTPSLFFDMPPEKISHFEFSVRHNRDVSVLRHISLRPGVSHDAFVDGNSALGDEDTSVYDTAYLDLFHQIAANTQRGDISAAMRACTQFLAETKPRIESIEGTSHEYLLAAGVPALHQLMSDLNARNGDAALALLNAQTPSANHLWQLTTQLALLQPRRSLRYP